MNKKQKSVIIVGIILLILSGFFPPWRQASRASGYTFYHNVITDSLLQRGYEIDKPHLLIQSLIIIVAMALLVMLLEKLKLLKLNIIVVRKVIISVGLGLFLLMGLFPPWLGYSEFYCLFDPPKTSIDIARLFLQWTLVAVTTGVIIYLLKDKDNDK